MTTLSQQSPDEQGSDTAEMSTDQFENVEIRSDLIVEIEPILEAEAKHGPGFRRELFDAAYLAWQKSRLDYAEEREEGGDGELQRNEFGRYTVNDIYGVEQKMRIRLADTEIERTGQLRRTRSIWMYNSLQHLGHFYHEGMLDMLNPYSFGWHYLDREDEPCSRSADFEEKAKVWEQDWQCSNLYSQFITFLEQHIATTAVRVDKIVCFGLGCFLFKHASSGKRSYTQHLAASTIRDTIALRQGGAPPQVYVQDPIYCTASIALLQTRFGFKVLADPEGFKLLDQHTFVMTVAPNVPVLQIALGLTHNSGGPAGFLCNDIFDDGTVSDVADGGETVVGKGIRRLSKTCDTSPGLWKYKQESVWMECSDSNEDNSFGSMGLYLKRK